MQTFTALQQHWVIAHWVTAQISYTALGYSTYMQLKLTLKSTGSMTPFGFSFRGAKTK
jgi:hypothetical protein